MFLRRIAIVYRTLYRHALKRDDRGSLRLHRRSTILHTLEDLDHRFLEPGAPHAINISGRRRRSYGHACRALQDHPSTVTLFLVLGALRGIEREVRALLHPMFSMYRERAGQ